MASTFKKIISLTLVLLIGFSSQIALAQIAPIPPAGGTYDPTAPAGTNTPVPGSGSVIVPTGTPTGTTGGSSTLGSVIGSIGSFYTPQNTNYVSDNTFGGQVFNTGSSALIGCSSGLLAGEATQGISSLTNLLVKKSKSSPGAVQVNDTSTQSKIDTTNKIQSCLNAAAYAVAQKTLQEMSQRTLNWVNTGGANGSPLYVRDVGSYLTSISNNKIYDFTHQSISSDSLFGPAVRAVVQQNVTGSDGGYFNKIANANYQYAYTTTAQTTLYCAQDYQSQYASEDAACLKKTSSDPTADPVGQCRTQIRVKYDNLANQNCVGKTVKQFNDFQHDFTQGGWDTWLSSIQNDDNNPIGALFKASDQLSTSISTQQQQATDEINRNGGFLDMKVCTQYASNSPNTFCADPINAQSAACANGQAGLKTYCSSHSDQTVCQQLANVGKCLSYQTTTPGKIIADQVSQVTGSPITNAENIDQINEVLQSFFTGLLNNFLQGGLGLLQNKGSSVPSYAVSYADNTVYNADGSSYQNPFASITQNSYDTAEFDISRPQDLRAVIQAQADYVNKLKDAQVELNRLTPLTGKLDYLLAGPNPSWPDYVDQNFSELMSSLSVGGQKNTWQQIGSTYAQFGGTVGSLIASSIAGAPVGAAIAITTQIVGWELGLFKSNKLDFNFDNPILTDKASGGTVTIGGHGYETWSHDTTDTQGVDPIGFFESAYNVLRSKFIATYSPQTLSTALGNAYAAVDSSEPTYARGEVAQALSAVGKLISYSQNAPALDADYAQQITDTESTIAQLNSIMSQVNVIINGNGKSPSDPEYIEGAKNRYIREQKTAGNPVDIDTVTIDTRTGNIADANTPTADQKSMSCIDYAYQINTSPVAGTKRQTSDIQDPVVVQSQQASDNFYNSIKINP